MKTVPVLNEEDAFRILLHYLRLPGAYSDYGYELYLPKFIRHFLQQEHGIEHHESDPHLRSLSPHFYAAAWELCRRGIIRPGIKEHALHGPSDGPSGNGYSITPFGRVWLAESDRDDYVPTEPGRFGAMLKPFQGRFGPGFYERAQQAIRCYGAHAYLACCAMCGAAAESILLKIAIAKAVDETTVLREYSSRVGVDGSKLK